MLEPGNSSGNGKEEGYKGIMGSGSWVTSCADSGPGWGVAEAEDGSGPAPALEEPRPAAGRESQPGDEQVLWGKVIRCEAC